MQRISFEVNNFDLANGINEVLVDVSSNKVYPGNGVDTFNTTKAQGPQKGGTCLYYILNYLRFRYGKNFSLVHEGRRLELIFSAHHKGIAQIEQKYEIIAKTNPHLSQQTIKLLETQEFIKLFEKTFAILNINPREALRNFFHKHKLVDHLTPKDLIPTFIYHCYANILFDIMIESYQLQASSWHPRDGIDALADVLRNNGACFFGISAIAYNRSRDVSNENFGKRRIIEWHNELNHQQGTGHAILIVGVKRNGDSKHVYYIDPNFSNKNIIFKLSYNEFCKRLMATNGIRYDSPLAAHAQFFGIQSSDHVRDLEQFFNVDKSAPKAKL